MRERDKWGSEWVRERGRLLKRERVGSEREKERQGEYENREGKEKSLKNRCAKMYASNECEHSVISRPIIDTTVSVVKNRLKEKESFPKIL